MKLTSTKLVEVLADGLFDVLVDIDGTRRRQDDRVQPRANED
jgi:hypothetical protein